MSKKGTVKIILDQDTINRLNRIIHNLETLPEGVNLTSRNPCSTSRADFDKIDHSLCITLFPEVDLLRNNYCPCSYVNEGVLTRDRLIEQFRKTAEKGYIYISRRLIEEG